MRFYLWMIVIVFVRYTDGGRDYMRILYLVCVLFSFYFCFFDGYIEFVKGLFLF